ncbi:MULTISPECIES: DUF2690 domain-containing protein [unclassified Streptomyces]|uniref:helix-turn-helix domain-containing protein n=1 Tax=unclassified Streptomyces TaxID=2593676 RepID=UPI0037F586EC
MRSAAPAVELAVELRSLKQGSGLSFARLSQHTHYAKSSWERWVNGKQFPPRTAVESIAALCDSDPAPLLELWERANEERAAANDEPGSTEAAVPDTANAADAPAEAGAIDTGRAPDGADKDESDAHGAEADDASAGANAGEADASADAGDPGRAHRARRRRIVWGAVLASLVVVAAATIAFASGLFGHAKAAAQPQPSLIAGPPVGCTGTQCEDKDPKKMNCGADAVTVRTGSIPKDLVIELRYSRACAAAWGRISFAEVGATVVVNNSDGAASANVVHYDRDVYTPLIAAPKDGSVWVCAALPKGGAENCTGRFIPDKEH